MNLSKESKTVFFEQMRIERDGKTKPEGTELNAQMSMLDGSGAYNFPKRACD